MKKNKIYPLDSHPMDGRINIVEDGIVPTLTDKLRKGSADGPLLLIVKEKNNDIESLGSAIKTCIHN